MKEEFDHKKLLIRFFDHSATDDELNELTHWLSESNENKQLFNEFNESHQFADITLNGWVYDLESNWTQLKNRIKKDQRTPEIKILSKVHYLWLRSTAIIAVMLMLGSIAWMFQKQLSTELHHSPLSVVAPPGQKSKVELQDGSTVWLNSGSVLTYAYNAVSKKRIVKLQGEAFFDVAKDKTKPFIVSTDEIDLVVYGTRFNVQAYEDEEIIEATLEEGSIGVNISSSGREWLLKPGQQCIYNKLKKTIDIKYTNVNKYICWKEDKLVFDENTLEEVVQKLERWYGISIELDPQLNNSEKLTLTVTHESLTEILEILKVVAPIQYEINERNVRIIKRN